MAIEGDFALLASPDTTNEEKLVALKLLGHWVGDIHQPLHVSFEDDRLGTGSAHGAPLARTSRLSGSMSR
jgi:S1/P1 Nuclease